MSNWREKVESKNDFINLSQPFKGKFMGAEFTQTKFGDALQLQFLDQEGNKKILNTKSVRLQNIMKGIPDETVVKLIRTGEGYDTFYEVEVLQTAGKANDKRTTQETIEEIGKRNSASPEAQEVADQWGGGKVIQEDW